MQQTVCGKNRACQYKTLEYRQNGRHWYIISAANTDGWIFQGADTATTIYDWFQSAVDEGVFCKQKQQLIQPYYDMVLVEIEVNITTNTASWVSWRVDTIEKVCSWF